MSRGSIDFVRWAREQRMTAWGLTPAHGNTLRTLAMHSDRDGECEPSVVLLAETVGYTREHMHRLLRDLDRVGLIATRRRGRRPAVRRLCIDAQPAEQLRIDLDSTPQCDITLDSQRDLPTETRVTSGDHTKQEKGLREEGAREDVTSNGAPETPLGLADTLERVLEVFRTLPDIDAEPLSVNAMLLAHPESEGFGHERAALTVASWSLEGGLWSRSAPRLLQRALLKQTDAGRQQVNAITPPAPSSRRGGRPARQAKPWDGALARARREAEGAA